MPRSFPEGMSRACQVVCGMKILSANPGWVYHTGNPASPWRFFVVLDFGALHGIRNECSPENYKSASSAKQAMRERVQTLRRQHHV